MMKDAEKISLAALLLVISAIFNFDIFVEVMGWNIGILFTLGLGIIVYLGLWKNRDLPNI